MYADPLSEAILSAGGKLVPSLPTRAPTSASSVATTSQPEVLVSPTRVPLTEAMVES